MNSRSVLTSPLTTVSARRPGLRRLAIWLVVMTLMAVGFLGYLMPSVRLNWETIAALCGF